MTNQEHGVSRYWRRIKDYLHPGYVTCTNCEQNIFPPSRTVCPNCSQPVAQIGHIDSYFELAPNGHGEGIRNFVVHVSVKNGLAFTVNYFGPHIRTGAKVEVYSRRVGNMAKRFINILQEKEEVRVISSQKKALETSKSSR